MKIKKILLPLFIILVSFLFIKPLDSSRAKTFGELLDNLASLEQQKKDQEEQVALSQAEYQRLSNQISESQAKVSEYNSQIAAATNKIQELEVEIEKKKEETDKILVFLQLSSGEKSYLEYIFKATSFTDFIHRISVVEEISKYNKELIKEMNELIKEQEELKKELNEKIRLEEEERKRLEEMQRQVGSRINELYSEGANIDERIRDQKEIIEFYQSNGCTERGDILSLCSGVPPATGFLRPLDRGIVTSDYGYRIHPITGVGQGHTGIDISDSGYPLGKPVYAVAAGKVAFLVNWDCGGRVVGIHHVVRGVEYTSMYMHLQSFNVNVGDIVTADDVIGHMGGIYDSCSTGPHVHLSMTYGHLTDPGSYRVYMFDPNDVIYFPNSWFYYRSW